MPAISSPAGRVGMLPAKGDNEDLNSARIKSNGWGRDRNLYERSWLHSDIKNMAYKYVYKAFDLILEKGGLK